MKRVLLRDRGMFKARDVLIGMIENPPPNQGLGYQEMRKRDRLIGIIERHKESYVDFEDADHEVLMSVLNSSSFITGKRELKLILDDIADAKAPEDTVQLKLVDEK